jgi:hypothetical protein
VTSALTAPGWMDEMLPLKALRALTFMEGSFDCWVMRWLAQHLRYKHIYTTELT